MITAASPAFAQQASAPSDANVIDEVVVTAQRREESIQDVPLAVSAFSQETLQAQRVETGSDLLIAVPNTSFTRGNFGGYNFQIRGIGTKLVATGADAAIGVHVNSVPLGASTLADSEFFDVERVEVLRGPQGTQFGRNSTGGLVNIVTNKPTDEFEGSITGDIGNYETRRVKGFVNVPIPGVEGLGVRLAGSYVNRGGFGYNAFTGNDIDGRDLYATRLTVGYEPNDRFNAQFIWEHFDEDDDRTRVGKQLCVSDPGLTAIGGVPTNLPGRETGVFFSQGCRQADLSGDNAFGAVNTAITAGGGPLGLFGIQTGNANAGKTQIRDLRTFESVFDPIYQNQTDYYELLLSYDVTDSLTLSYSGGYSESEAFTSADYNRLVPTLTFNPNVPPLPGGGVTDANGFIDDPQVGRRNKFTTIDFSNGQGESYSHEVRLQSDFDYPVNFSAGASYGHLESETDYFVTSNSLTAIAQFLNLTNPAGCPKNGDAARTNVCIYVDPNPIPDGSGHNYFDSRSQYELTSRAFFGELYVDVTEDLRLTLGFRNTEDEKTVNPFSPALIQTGPLGQRPLPQQNVTFNENTGRVNLEWSPELGFTDESLFYASYARGYKGGGFNPPPSPGLESLPRFFQPEFINAYEVGTKNTLLGGALVLNATGFFYDYKNYQVSSIIQRTSINVNIDAEVSGAELEAIWEPVNNLRFNAALGYLKTEIQEAASLDLMNLTQGNAAYQTLKAGYNLNYNNCIAPVDQLAALQTAVNAAGGAIPPVLVVGTNPAVLAPVFGAGADAFARGVCGGAFLPGQPLQALTGVTVVPFGLTADRYAAAGLPATLNGFDLTQPGIPADITGNELPNSPEFTVSLGAQYSFELANGWAITPRVDYYYQTEAYARIFNAINDKLDSYSNVNATLNFEFPDWGVSALLYVKNATDEEVITDKYLTDDASGLFTNIFLTEPRTYGIAVTKTF